MGVPKGFLGAVGTSHSVSTWWDHIDHHDSTRSCSEKVNRSFKTLQKHPTKDRRIPAVTPLLPTQHSWLQPGFCELLWEETTHCALIWAVLSSPAFLGGSLRGISEEKGILLTAQRRKRRGAEAKPKQRKQYVTFSQPLSALRNLIAQHLS